MRGPTLVFARRRGFPPPFHLLKGFLLLQSLGIPYPLHTVRNSFDPPSFSGQDECAGRFSRALLHHIRHHIDLMKS